MFNGIIKKTGRIEKIYNNNKNCIIEILSKIKFKKSDIGSSISCSGACLTVNGITNKTVKFYITRETINRTTFKKIRKGDVVNLEKPMKYGERISGHFVQGHIDTTATVKNIKIIGKSWLINFKLKKNFKKYIVQKGSISVNGVSLTISNILNYGFQISVIPKTLSMTNLIYLKSGDLVNVEFDVLGKYIKNFIK